MKAVWSFWSKPYLAQRKATWPSEKHHLLAWVLSLETAKQHYAETSLCTDDAGARLLVEELGLSFTQVSTALNSLAHLNPEWWTLGKLYAYHQQNEPFVHIDNDVFLWKRLPKRIEQAPVFAQNPEPFIPGFSYYRPEQITRTLQPVAGAWLPDEWQWYQRAGLQQHAECCGIFGGQGIDFIHHYAGAALRLIDNPINRTALDSLPDKSLHMVSVEQYLLAAYLEYHTAHPASLFHRIKIAYLFNSGAEAFNPECAAQAGYTHLAASAKRNSLLARRLENCVRRDYPEYYRRCNRLASSVQQFWPE